MASDIDRAVRASKRLEGLLQRRLSARGRGLHEKVNSVQSRLDAQLVRDLRTSTRGLAKPWILAAAALALGLLVAAAALIEILG